MTQKIGHLSEEDLIDHYYGEGATEAAARHIKVCARCGDEYAALQRDLAAVKSPAAPSRQASYGTQVWASIRGSVEVYRRPGGNWFTRRFLEPGPWRPLAWSTACLLLMTVAFLAGRVWQQKSPQTMAVAGDAQARQRVVVLVLGDHLDRSERLLVELNHADGKDAAVALPLQSEARELLAANRLVRQSARQTGDPHLDASLDRLERLLVELANEPNGLDDADLNRLRQEMNTDGLLFDVRILRSHVSEQQRHNTANRSEGVSL